MDRLLGSERQNRLWGARLAEHGSFARGRSYAVRHETTQRGMDGQCRSQRQVPEGQGRARAKRGDTWGVLHQRDVKEWTI